MGSPDCKGLPPRVFRGTPRQRPPPRLPTGVLRDSLSGGGATSQGSYRRDTGNIRVFQPNVPSLQEGWGVAPSYKFEESEPLHISKAFQDGDHSQPTWYLEGGRLHGQTRFERRLSNSPYPPRPQTVSEVYFSGEAISVQDTPLWSSHGPKGFHKASETSSLCSQSIWHSPYSLHRRHFDHGELPYRDYRECTEYNSPAGEPGFHYQLEQECPEPKPNNGIPWVAGGFNLTHSECSKIQAVKDCQGMPAFPTQGHSVREGPCSFIGSTDICKYSSPSRSSSLQGITKTEASDTTSVWFSGCLSHSGQGGQEGPIILDSRSPVSEWEVDKYSTSATEHLFRCFTDRLGSQCRGSIDFGSLVKQGEVLPHQSTRATGSLSGSQDLCCQQDIPPHYSTAGQCHSNCLSQQEGRYSFQVSLRPGNFNLAVVFGQEFDTACSTYSRSTEFYCRLAVQERNGIQRLEIRPTDFQVSNEETGLLLHRSVCSSPQHTAKEILQLSSRSRGRRSGCFITELEGADMLCLSPVCHSGPGPAEINTGQSESCNSHCSQLAISSLVSITNPALSSPSHPPPTNPAPFDKSTRGTTPSDSPRPYASSRLEGLRSSGRYSKLSEEAFALLSSAWRKGTEKSYTMGWRKWCGWCQSLGRDPFAASIEDIIEFLTSEFHAGRQYSTINSLRSALSATLPPIEGTPVGQHPLIVKLLQGIFNQRPPLPRYENTWNVGSVISFIKNNLNQNSNLSLKDLSRKLAMLLALASASRSSDLHLLDLRYIKHSMDYVEFQIAGLLKTRRSGPPRSFTIKRLPTVESLCPVVTLEAYERVTQPFRGAIMDKSSKLFLSLKQPHNPVSSSTIGRWIKSLLTDAGIDTSIFGAHSTRAASSSAAKKAGVPLSDIMRAAGWSRSSTFERFYYKPILSPQVGDILLSSGG